MGVNNNINGLDAIRLAREISALPDGKFTIAYFPYSRVKDEARDHLVIKKGCRIRAQLPQDKWETDGDAYFLFENEDGEPRTCHRILLRFIGFPPTFKLRKVEWLSTPKHCTDKK